MKSPADAGPVGITSVSLGTPHELPSVASARRLGLPRPFLIWINRTSPAALTLQPVDAPTAEPFRLLNHEQFAKLSLEEKVAYVSKAIEAVKQNLPILNPEIPVADSASD